MPAFSSRIKHELRSLQRISDIVTFLNFQRTHQNFLADNMMHIIKKTNVAILWFYTSFYIFMCLRYTIFFYLWNRASKYLDVYDEILLPYLMHNLHISM